MVRARARGLCFQLKTSEKYWARLAKFEVLGIVDFWQFCKKRSTSPMHNFLNFEPLEVFLDFLESLRCPISNPFSIISIWYSMLMYEALKKKVFFVDFSKWPIMSKFITSCECIFWTWEMKMNCRELHPLKNEPWMENFW